MGLFNFFKKSNDNKDNSDVIPGAESVVECFSKSYNKYTLYVLDGKVYYKNQVLGTYQKEDAKNFIVKTNMSSVIFGVDDDYFKSRGHFYTSFFQTGSLIYSNNPALLPEHIEKSSTEVDSSLISSMVDDTIAKYKGDCAGAIAAFVCAHSVLITDSIYHSVFTD